MKKVAVVMGSASDAPVMLTATEILQRFGVEYEVEVMSAHRTPERVRVWTEQARDRGVAVIVAGAGGAAHLAGVIAAHTTLPVVGVPLDASPLHGVDSLYATVQMPAGVPVACVAIGKPGATNAAILAVEILGITEAEVASKLGDYRRRMAEDVARKSEELKASLAAGKSPS
ncbi:MAG: 5-(carboxyamino)imidazole ribonucleotide mutase [Acidobacteriota bacterium]